MQQVSEAFYGNRGNCIRRNFYVEWNEFTNLCIKYTVLSEKQKLSYTHTWDSSHSFTYTKQKVNVSVLIVVGTSNTARRFRNGILAFLTDKSNN